MDANNQPILLLIDRSSKDDVEISMFSTKKAIAMDISPKKMIIYCSASFVMYDNSTLF